MAFPRVLLTGACGVTSRSLARAIRLDSEFRDARLIGMDTGENLFGFFEGLCDSYFRVPTATSRGYWPAVRRVQETEGLNAALVVPEVEVLEWGRQRDSVIPSLVPPPTFAQTAGSKAALYDALAGSGLVPDNLVGSAEYLAYATEQLSFNFPAWIRPHEMGASSGRAAGRIEGPVEILSWAARYPNVASWQLVRFLSGRNVSANMLMIDGKFVAGAQYERLDYFMASTTISGVTGNISRGKLVHEPGVASAALAALRILEEKSGEFATGLLGVDLMVPTDSPSRAFVTEVNLRPTACIELFGLAGFNLAALWLHASLGTNIDQVGWAKFEGNQEILRDIHGRPILADMEAQMPWVELNAD